MQKVFQWVSTIIMGLWTVCSTILNWTGTVQTAQSAFQSKGEIMGMIGFVLMSQWAPTVAFLIGVVFLYYTYHGAPRWMRRPKLELAYIYAQLSIDPCEAGVARYRIRLKNGKQAIENIRMRTVAPGFKSTEYNRPLAGMLAPEGQMEAPIGVIPLKIEPYGSLLVEIYYDNSNGHFIATHRFSIGPINQQPQIINPELSHYKEGTLPPAEATDELQDGLLSPEGTVFFVLEEVDSNGKELGAQGTGNRQREFLFDPLKRRVSFATVTESGRVAFMVEELPIAKKHIISLGWTRHGGYLHVNGSGSSDFDDGHFPDQGTSEGGEGTST